MANEAAETFASMPGVEEAPVVLICKDQRAGVYTVRAPDGTRSEACGRLRRVVAQVRRLHPGRGIEVHARVAGQAETRPVMRL